MARELTGTVVSTKMNKTIVVQIVRRFQHDKYRKIITRHNKFKAHYEGSELKEGDFVRIRETKPISKDKHFIVVGTEVPEKPAVKAAPRKRTVKAQKAK